jgi:multicomponent K+:H+ antiporter subunit C
MAFDLGVYLVVVGATLQILIHLGLMHDASHGPGACPIPETLRAKGRSADGNADRRPDRHPDRLRRLSDAARRTFPVVLGLTFLSYAVNLFLFAMGRLTIGRPPVIGTGLPGYTDPVPQALVLTAIVIGFAMTAFVIMLALKARAELGNDHVDGEAQSE